MLKHFCCLAAFMFSVIAHAQEMTSAPVELNELGEPLKPNERRVPRSDFNAEMEKHWGVKLSEIEDEFIKKVDDETLFISANGDIFIKKVVPGYAGETGKSYPSTEEMLRAEARWDELAGYLQKIRENVEPLFSAVLNAHPRITLGLNHTQVSIGEKLIITMTTAGVRHDAVLSAGLALGYDPRILRFDNMVPAPGVRVIDQQVRRRSVDRESLRLRVQKESDEAQKSGALVQLRFTALRPGSTTVEPLSAGIQSELGKTFIVTKDSAVRPNTAPVTVHVR